MKWISVEDEDPKGPCIVLLEKEILGSRVHSAAFEKEYTIVGGHFDFDMPKVTHFIPMSHLPKFPEDV